MAKVKNKTSDTELKANLKDILKTVLVLFLIAAVSGGLLGGINKLTYMSEDEILSQKIVKIYEADSFINLANASETHPELNSIVTEFNKTEGANKTLALLPVKNGSVEEGTVIYRSYGKGDYDCTLLVLVKNNKIEKVAVYSSSATPGIGDKAYKDNFINQYKNFDLLKATPFEPVKKPSKPNEVEAVAGATKSSVAVNNSINQVVKLHQALFGGKA